MEGEGKKGENQLLVLSYCYILYMVNNDCQLAVGLYKSKKLEENSMNKVNEMENFTSKKS